MLHTVLEYPDFDSYAYPALKKSYTINLVTDKVRTADYSKSDNPPILHRKETFVAENYAKRKKFIVITKEGEALGLYEKARTIGFRKNWERLIKSNGHFLDDEGLLKPIEKKELQTEAEFTGKVARHKTAIDRDKLSAPMQVLARHEYFNGDYSILDYGCGKGDDVRELEAHGLDVNAWDPVHRPEGDLKASDIVNLGFVINVIEDIKERKETLKKAYKYSQKILIVSVMVAGESVINQFQPYKDGVITSRNTFQRYYAQSEFKHYLESNLKDNAIAVGQGVFVVFKDKLEEQHFLIERQHIRRDRRQITQRELKTRIPSTVVKKDLIEKHQELFDDFWETTLDLGRIPANSEFDFSERLRAITGSHKKAFDALLDHHGEELYQQAQQARKNDLMVYFALGLFDQRKPYKDMPEGLKRDIKTFFGKYSDAVEVSTKKLFSVGKPDVIERKAVEAYGKFSIGEFNEGHSWIVPVSLINELAPELRIYIGCASQLYGDLDGIHLVKIHFTSGKVSLLKYDDFKKDVPLLMERIKIRLRDQEMDFFVSDEKFKPTPLENKELFRR